MDFHEKQAMPVSVLLPVYNGEDELRGTVDFILQQTFSDFELLMLDDGSSDGTWAIMQEYAAKDSRIKLFKNEQNQGVVKSTITLTNAATGEILIKEDCGDWSAPDRYETQYRVLMENPNASGCVSDYWLVETDGTPIGIRRMPATAEALETQVKIANMTAHSTFAMRKSSFDQVGGYNVEIPYSLDYGILLRLMTVGPVIPIHRALAAVTLNPAGLTFRNLPKQDACASLIRSEFTGEGPPASIDFAPLTPEQAEAEYHFSVGRTLLAKGFTRRARAHFMAAAKVKHGPEMKKLLFLSKVPGPVIRLARQVLKRNNPEEMQTPFFQRQ